MGSRMQKQAAFPNHYRKGCEEESLVFESVAILLSCVSVGFMKMKRKEQMNHGEMCQPMNKEPANGVHITKSYCHRSRNGDQKSKSMTPTQLRLSLFGVHCLISSPTAFVLRHH